MRDIFWSSSGGTFRARNAPTMSGSYVPVVGDYDGDGDDDVVLYAAGPAPDHIWMIERFAVRSQAAPAVSGPFRSVRPIDLDGDGRDEVLWYASPGRDVVWWHGAGVLDRASSTNVALR